MQSVTFVSAFIELEQERAKEFSRETYFSLFESLANANLNLVVFLEDKLIDIAKFRWPHVKFEVLNLEDLETFKIVHSHPNFKLPPRRTGDKDTASYFILINSKTEIVRRVIESPKYQKTTHYAWIDFGISKVLKKNVRLTLSQLKDHVETTIYEGCVLLPNEGLCFPGFPHA